MIVVGYCFIVDTKMGFIHVALSKYFFWKEGEDCKEKTKSWLTSGSQANLLRQPVCRFIEIVSAAGLSPISCDLFNKM